MSGVLAAMLGGGFGSGVLNGTIGVGVASGNYGYRGSSPAYGTLTPTVNFVDGGGNTRGIFQVSWNDPPGAFQLLLATANIPDTDTTFRQLLVNGVPYLRSTRSSYIASVAGPATQWIFAQNGAHPLTGNVSFIVQL